MNLRFPTQGGWRRWLGARFGGDFELGDRIWRRMLHMFAAVVLLYFALPFHLVAWFTMEDLLLIGLAAVLVLEGVRWATGLELPTIRSYEKARVASYTFYAVALVAAVLLFPEPIAAVAVLGTAFVDPLVGELRLTERGRALYPWLPATVYVLLGAPALVLLGHWSSFAAVVAAGIAAVLALAVERPKLPYLDDDLAMTLVPALALFALTYLLPGVFR